MRFIGVCGMRCGFAGSPVYDSCEQDELCLFDCGIASAAPNAVNATVEQMNVELSMMSSTPNNVNAFLLYVSTRVRVCVRLL